MKSRLCFIIPLLVYGLLPVVLSSFDAPIYGPDGSILFFGYSRNRVQIYDVPSGDLIRDIKVAGDDVCYWPKARSLLAANRNSIYKVDLWGDLSSTVLLDQLETGTFWIYVRLEMRENWILAGAINLSPSSLNLYRINVNEDMTLSNTSLLASETVFSNFNLLVGPTMSPENRYVYAVNNIGIFRVPYDGGPTEQVVVDSMAISPTVIIEEQRLFYIQSHSPSTVKSCDLDGGNSTTIYYTPFRLYGASQYGDWLVTTILRNAPKEYLFINLKTNETRKITNVPQDGSLYTVRSPQFLGFGEIYKAHGLLSPAVVRARNGRKVTVTTAVSSAGGVQHQYLSRFERLDSTGTISGLPPSSMLDYSGLQPAKLVFDSENSNKMDERTGVYLQSIITPYGDETTITIVVQSQGKLTFNKPTVTVNVGDSVTLSVPKPMQRHIRWRHNGRIIPEWSRRRSATIENVTMADAGVYESYLWLRRKLGRHGIMRLIVRGCPSGYCNPPNCAEVCPDCYNGGVPIDNTVDDIPCICAPGFMGNNCTIASPTGRFGIDGELSCPDDDCKGVLICQPDPYGCSCAAGYRGPDCNKRCQVGTFGASCELNCNCNDNLLCDRTTGSCQGAGGCQLGWSGDNCQISTDMMD